MHHNTESLQTMLTRSQKSGAPNPKDIKDTGDELCRVCEHKRSMVDGEKVCLLCIMWIFLKED